MSIPVILLPGWGNTINEFYKLSKTMDNYYNRKIIFDYSYKAPEDEIDTDTGIYAPFETMRERLYQFLSDSSLLRSPLNLVGFSEGGIIALYTSAIKNDITVNKYISIASPYHGAYNTNFYWFHDNDSVTKQLEWESDFMKDGWIYENASAAFFNIYTMNNLLQIFSNTDTVVTPQSVLRFKNKMEVFEVTSGFICHNALPRNTSVIDEVISFLG